MLIRRLVAGIVVSALSAAAAIAVENVRVDVSTGVPRLMLDGRPARARIFWGAPGSRPLPVGPAAQLVGFDFSPTASEPATATMHIRFGASPGDVYLDDIHVVDLDTGRDVFPVSDFEGGDDSFSRSWTFWPAGSQNSVGTVRVESGKGRDGTAALHIAIKAPPDGRWPDFHCYHHPNLALQQGHRYQVRFWARAEPARDLTVAFYRPGRTYTFLGGPAVFEPQIRLAAAAGVDLVSFPVDMPWPKPGAAADWSTADAQCQTVLGANPKALLLPRIGVDPPRWWRDAHPDEVMVWDKGPQEHGGAVVASPLYRRDAAARLSALIAHLEAKVGDRVAGYHPCGQNTGEWFYQDTWNLPLNGYAKADLRAWRVWLKSRYRDDAALRAAWRDPQAALDSAAVPTPAARRQTSGILRDPITERPLIDFARFQQEMMADCVCHLARAVRQASQGRKLVLFFYGYGFEFGAIRNGPATSGHYGLRRVLGCPDVDVLCSPISYFDRGLGESAPAMTAAESVALAGKMWLYEDDTSTYLSTGTPPGFRERVRSIEETNAQLVRNTAQCALRNFATWWMDLTATGWFNDARMWAQMRRLAVLDEPLLHEPRPFHPEVAAVIDEESMIRVAAGGNTVTGPGVYEVRRPLGRMGAPYGQYLLDDVTQARVHAKVFVFLTAWCLSPEQRKQVLAATRGSLKVWCYAPGYQEDDRTSLDAMAQLTGLKIRKLAGAPAWAEPTSAGKKLGLREGFGVKRIVNPLFAAVDAKPEETLATYADGSAAVALRRTSDGHSLFVGPPGLTSQLLRAAGRQAGVHLFTQVDCNVCANGPYLLLHGSQDGPLEIDAGAPGPIRDLLGGQIVGQGPKTTLTFKKGETRLLLLGAR